MKKKFANNFIALYMQIGVNVIGLPEFFKLEVPIYREVTSKYHK